MNKIGILYHPLVETTQVKAKELKEFLESNGASAWLCSAWDEEKAKSQLSGTNLVLTVGGDGTILRAAQVVIPGTIPVTGVNLGRLGFLTEFTADEAREKLPLLLKKESWIDERAMLEAELVSKEQESPRSFHALNDVVVARGSVARLVQIETKVNSQHLTTYRADGVILATATGSTGYALAAGGPILYPQSSDFLLVPILPHLTPAHSIVVSSTAVVQLRVTSVYQATLSIDGHINLPLASGDVITVKLSPNTVRFMRVRPGAPFYGSLEQKLKGRHL